MLDAALATSSRHRGRLIRRCALDVGFRGSSGRVGAGVSSLEALDELLVVGPCRTLAVTDALHSVAHLEKVLDVPRGHLGRVAYLSGLRVGLIVRGRRARGTLSLLGDVLARGRCLLFVVRVGSVASEEAV